MTVAYIVEFEHIIEAGLTTQKSWLQKKAN